MRLSPDGYPEVRLVTRKDRRTLSALIKRLAERSGESGLLGMIPATPPATAAPIDATEPATAAPVESADGAVTPADQIYDLVRRVFDGLIGWAEEDLAAWFRDLTSATAEEYDDLPFDVEIHIIDRLLSQAGFKNFFSRASELAKKIRGLISQ